MNKEYTHTAKLIGDWGISGCNLSTADA